MSGTADESEVAENPWDVFRIPDDLLQQLLAKWTDEGLNEDEIEEKLGEIVERAVGVMYDEVTANLVDDLRVRRRRVLRADRRQRRAFEGRLRRRWGQALDIYHAAYMSAEQFGASFNTKNRPAAVAENDYRFEALCQIHARACATASAIHALLRTGHAPDAHARWRTLHELAVVALVLGENDPSLSERYLLHVLVSDHKDSLQYQKHCVRLGYEPFSAQQLADFKDRRDAVVLRFGPKFATDWGWAEPVIPSGKSPTFDTLEELAGVGHLRPYYKWSTHTTHAGAKGTALNGAEMRGQMTLRAGPSNAGLADPGHSALISLLQVTTSLVLRGRGEAGMEPSTVPMLRAIDAVVAQAGDAFLAAHQQLERDEAEIAAKSTPHAANGSV